MRATKRFLVGAVTARKEPHELQLVLQTMVRIGHPDAADAIDRCHEKAGQVNFLLLLQLLVRPHDRGPAEKPLPKFEELLPTLPDKMVDQLMDSVLALKNKPE